MILAAGATGRRRPVVEELLARGRDVRVTAREPGSSTGRRFAFGRVPLTSLAPGLRALFEWLARIGHQVDIGGLRRSLPDVHWHTFEGWAGAQDWSPQGTKSSQSRPDRDRGHT
jgi:hypothetical protein